MTRSKKILLIVSILAVILIAAVNVFLYFGLTSIAKKSLPDITRKTGVGIDFNRLSASIPGGTVKLSGLVVNNPKDFTTNDTSFLSVGDAKVRIGLLSLPFGIINLSSINVNNAKVTVVKIETGKINAVMIGESAKPKAPETTTQTGTGEGSKQPSSTGEKQTSEGTPKASPPLPKARIGTAKLNTIVEYIDFQANPTNGARLTLDLKIKANDIRTYGDPGKNNGTFSIKGHLAGKPDSMVINLKGETAPLTDPARPSFEMEGSVTNIFTRDFKEIADAIGIEADRIDFAVNIKCVQGAFIIGPSLIKVTMENLKLTGKSAGKARGMSISNLSVVVPLKGTIEKPDFDLIGALIETFGGNVNTMIKSINVDQKNVEKNINKFFDSILGGKKNKK